MRDRERERQSNRQREKQAPCREPNVGLDPGTPGSCPGLKAGTKPLSHPGIPLECLFIKLQDKVVPQIPLSIPETDIGWAG